MNATTLKRRQRGSAFITAAVVSAILALAVAGYLGMLSHEYSLNYRSAYWTQALHLAEMGIEVGVRELNYDYLKAKDGFKVSNGWTTSFTALTGAPAIVTGGYSKTVRNFADARGKLLGDFTIQVFNVGSTSAATVYPILIAEGTVTQIVTGPTISRKLAVIVAGNPELPVSIMAKQKITWSGSNAYVDSFNSLNNLAKYGSPAYVHTPGIDALANAIVATNATGSDAIDLGNGRIYGTGMVGPGGTVSCKDGYLAPVYNEVTKGYVQPGAVSTDFYRDIPSATMPADFSGSAPDMTNQPTITGPSTLSGAPLDVRVSSIDQAVSFEGWVRIRVNGDISLSALGDNLRVLKGSKVEMYLVGEMDVSGNGMLINDSADPFALFIYGLPSCDSIKITGGGNLVASVYAPDADVAFSGGAELTSGSFVAKRLSLAGNAAFHYDEALKTAGPISTFEVISWNEVTH
jgi:hypothetical protein